MRIYDILLFTFTFNLVLNVMVGFNVFPGAPTEGLVYTVEGEVWNVSSELRELTPGNISIFDAAMVFGDFLKGVVLFMTLVFTTIAVPGYYLVQLGGSAMSSVGWMITEITWLVYVAAIIQFVANRAFEK